MGVRVRSLGLVWLVLSPAAARPAVCINELLYDPYGPDEGGEFIELYNDGAVRVDLAGWRLEAGNGAVPGDWRVQWTGQAGESIAPQAFFLVAAPDAPIEADSRARLSLQNGPDAARLVAPTGVADLVGWGNHEFGEYVETAGAADVPSGWSLARVPDGRDSDDNHTDLVGRPYPTPGGANASPGLLLLGEPQVDPPVVDPGRTAELAIEVTNLSGEPLDQDALTWSVTSELLEVSGAVLPGGRLDPDGCAVATWTLAAAPDARGAEILQVSIRAPAGDVRTAQVRLCVGRGPLLISELQYDPLAGEGEWVELFNASATSIDLQGWQIRDASGRTSLFAAAVLPAGGYAVAAEDATGLLGRWPHLAAATLPERLGAWPSLNNSIDTARGFADEVTLLDPDGVPRDYVRYLPGGLDGGGISLERWIEAGRLIEPDLLVACASPGGATPGAAMAAVGGGGRETGWLRPEPEPFVPDEAGAERFCRIPVPAPESGSGRLDAAVYSLAGHPVATLSAAAAVHGPSLLVWDGCDAAGRRLPTGVYLVRIALAGTAACGTSCTVRPVVLVRG